MFFVGVDLAARHSAAVCIDENAVVHWESLFDAGQRSDPPRPYEHMTALVSWWVEVLERLVACGATLEDTVWVVENPHLYARESTPAVRLQGGLLALMAQADVETNLITAKEWQDSFGYTKKEFGDSKKWAATCASEFGYEPGQTWPEGTKILAKPKTDLRDAYLLSRWLRKQVMGV